MTSATDNAVMCRFAHTAFALDRILIGVVLGAIAWNFSGRIAPSS
ncbi:hypothetical protein [Rhodococcus qingshengii]|nr:hypothetical protein PI247_29615 [Rhodococcus qingshengii]